MRDSDKIFIDQSAKWFFIFLFLSALTFCGDPDLHDVLIERVQPQAESNEQTHANCIVNSRIHHRGKRMADLVKNDCYKCEHKRKVPGNCHIRCAKPDPKMTGYQHGIDKGWFIYPLLFDPVWMTKKCDNFQPKEVENATD